MSDKPAPRFRKTKTDKWAVMAPVEDLEKALAEGGKIDVLKRSGDWSTFTVASLGKPFDVDGVPMCYGYGPDEEGDGTPPAGSPSPPSSVGGGDRPRRVAASQAAGSRQASDSSSRSRPRRTSAPAVEPQRDPSEPLPEFRGGPEDEWDGYA